MNSPAVAGGRSIQLPFVCLPIAALTDPPGQIGTATCSGAVLGEDGKKYFVKGDKHNRYERANEWICTNLALTLGIKAPRPAIIRLLSGEHVYGSQAISDIDFITRIYLETESIGSPEPSASLSSIYALDLFIWNEDRHLGNFLSLRTNGVNVLYAYDFAYSLFYRWPFHGFPFGVNTRSAAAGNWKAHGFDPASALATIAAIEQLPVALIQSYIDCMPPDWLSRDLSSQLTKWWGSQSFIKRANEIAKGLQDGSLL